MGGVPPSSPTGTTVSVTVLEAQQQGRPGLVVARGKLRQDRYFKYFPTDANQITVLDALRRCLPAHRDSTSSTSNIVFYRQRFVLLPEVLAPEVIFFSCK